MGRFSFCLLFFCVVFTSSIAQSRDEMLVNNVLTAQTKCWNNGDLKGYMSTYWKSDSLLFVGKSGVTYGWQQTLNNYQKHYPDTTAMGKLNFVLVEVKRLSTLYFFVTGKWQLVRSIGDLNGAFTLLLKKINNRWVIVADHSS